MKLFYKTYGNPQQSTLFILHGLLGSGDNWHLLSQRFSENFFVIVPDMRNHGRSPHSEEFNFDVMCDDILEIMYSENISSAKFIGHSMGGKVAMNFAIHHAEKTKKIIVADIAPRQYPRGHDAIFKALFSIDISTLHNRKEVENILKKSIVDDSTILFLLKNLGRDDAGNFMWKPDLNSLYNNYDNICKAITGGSFSKPTLILRGENSKYITEKDEENIAELFPDSEIKTIANAGHWLHADQPEMFYNEAISFLSLTH